MQIDGTPICRIFRISFTFMDVTVLRNACLTVILLHQVIQLLWEPKFEHLVDPQAVATVLKHTLFNPFFFCKKDTKMYTFFYFFREKCLARQ